MDDHPEQMGMRNPYGGLCVDRTMTSTVGTGSVTAQIRGHVLRNDVLQQHIDAKIRLKYMLFLFLDGAAIIPRGDGVQ